MRDFSWFTVLVVTLAFANMAFAQSNDLVVTLAFAQSNDFVWKFVKVEPNPFSVQNKAPDLLYTIDMTVDGSGWVIGTHYRASELEPLLRYFGVDSPEELTGRTFKSAESDADSALDLLKIQLVHEFKYEPPTDEALYKRAAKALANMQLPDFSDVAEKDVFHSYQKAFDGAIAKPEWRAYLNAKIQEYSNGEVWLVKADYKQFGMRVKGPADYLLLVSKSGEKKRVILGPYSTPISFDQD